MRDKLGRKTLDKVCQIDTKKRKQIKKLKEAKGRKKFVIKQSSNLKIIIIV